MSPQDDNNKKVTSKIEQIRLDLEKKLAAIESSKKNVEEPLANIKSNSTEESINNIVSKDRASIKSPSKIKEVEKTVKVNKKEVNDNLKKVKPIVSKVKPEPIQSESIKPEVEKVAVESSPSFEITEPITPVIPKKKPNKSVVNKSESIGNQQKKVTSVSKPIVVVDSKIENKTNVTPVAKVKSKPNHKEEILVEETSRKGVFNYLLYGGLIALFALIAYLYNNYTRDSDKLKDEIMEQKLSEFKNKRYLDSIELADLNYQLLDLQSQKMIDSLDLIYEKELIARSSIKNKKTIKKIFTPENTVSKINSANLRNNNNEAIANANKAVLNNSLSNSTDNSTTNTNSLNKKDNSINNKENLKVNNEDAINEKNKNIVKKPTEEAVKNNENKEIQKENVVATIKSKPKKIKSPIYPGCEKKKTEIDRKKCLNSKMFRHVSRKFNSNLAQNIGLKQGLHQVRVSYIIDKSGYATVLNVRGENKKIEAEAIRVIQSLPKMVPGTVNGKRTKSQYNIPIKYMVEN